MAKRPTNVPDAWEDDWETQADKAATEEPKAQSSSQPAATMSRAERLAQHAESNRKIWESAEAPQATFHYVAAHTDPPLATFKPAMKVLSRKPARGANENDDDDDEGAKTKTPQLTPEEIAARRDEKQRRYDEARAKIFGITTSSSGTSTPSGAVTPPLRPADGGRGRGGGRGSRGAARGGQQQQQQHRRNDSRGDRERDNNNYSPRPGSQSGGGRGGERELYDPNYATRPGYQQQQYVERRPTPRDEEQQQVIRPPRGPDGSGRGGFGFAKRGAKGS